MSLKDIILDLFGSFPEPDRPAASPPKPKPAPARPAPPPAAAAAPKRDAGARDEAGVLAALRRAGAGYRRVVFTRNRRIMISVGGDRATLRLNAAFASAPEEVLHAVGVVYSTGRGRRKDAAKAVVRRFINEIPAAAPAGPRRPRRREVTAHDRPHLDRLQAEFERVNRLSFGGRLPRVPIFLSRKMRRRNGHFSSHPLEIVISHRLCTHGHDGEAEHTLRHEMIHLWQYMEGVAVDHGPAFRRMAHRLDVHPRAARPVRWKGR